MAMKLLRRIGGADLLCYLCSLLRHSVFFCLCSFAPIPISLFGFPLRFLLCYLLSFLFSPLYFLPPYFFLLFLSASRFSFSFFSLSFYFFSPLFPPSLFFLPLLCLVSPVSLFFHFFFLSLFRSVEEVYIQPIHKSIQERFNALILGCKSRLIYNQIMQMRKLKYYH